MEWIKKVMILFKCKCSYHFVLGKKRVVGPISVLMTHSLMTIEEWKDLYADCYAAFKRICKGEKSQKEKEDEEYWKKMNEWARQNRIFERAQERRRNGK